MPLYNISVLAEIVFLVAQSPPVQWATDLCPWPMSWRCGSLFSVRNERLSSAEECSAEIHPIFVRMTDIFEFAQKLLSDGYICMFLFI